MPAYFLNAVFEVLIVHLLAFKNKRINYEGLSSGRDFFLDEAVQTEAFGFCAVKCDYWLSARRKFIYYRDFQISIKGHCEGARDGGGGHHQHVRRTVLILAPEFGPLFHSETVLLIHDCESQALEPDIIFDKGVGAHDYAYAAVFKPGVDFPAFGCPGAACKQCSFHSSRGEIAGYVLEVLLCEDFCRGHYAGLAAVPHCNQGAQYSHHCLSATHITLQKAVHLMAGFHIVAYFGDYPFLCSREREGEGRIAFVECISHLWHLDAVVCAGAAVLLFQQGELKEEKLLEFQAVGGAGEGFLAFREVDIAQGISQGHQTVAFKEIVGDGFLLIGEGCVQCGLHDLDHHLACDPAVFQLFS